MKKILLFLFWAPLLSLLLIGLFVFYLFQIWNYSGPNQVFQIKQGEPFSQINYRLHKEGLISSSKIFYHYVKWKGSLTKFKVGLFELKTGSNMPQIYQDLIAGRPVTVKVTVPEGKNMYEVAQILEKAKMTTAEEFIKVAKNRQFLESIGINHGLVEGYLFPETYQFSPPVSATTIVRSMVEEHRRQIKNLEFNHPEYNYHQIITLASIVEKETGVPEERPLIAGVFLNRLKKRMRLQSDPTTIYGIFEKFNGNLTKNHLLEHTPYNTYRINGLPPGPIANPGLASIKAVLNPVRHNFLYFVSKNDGTHIFTPTYEDHLREVRKFQQNPRNREGKSWRDYNRNK